MNVIREYVILKCICQLDKWNNIIQEKKYK